MSCTRACHVVFPLLTFDPVEKDRGLWPTLLTRQRNPSAVGHIVYTQRHSNNEPGDPVSKKSIGFSCSLSLQEVSTRRILPLQSGTQKQSTRHPVYLFSLSSNFLSKLKTSSHAICRGSNQTRDSVILPLCSNFHRQRGCDRRPSSCFPSAASTFPSVKVNFHWSRETAACSVFIERACLVIQWYTKVSNEFMVTIWRSSKRPAADGGMRRSNRPEHPGDLETTAFRQSSRGRTGL